MISSSTLDATLEGLRITFYRLNMIIIQFLERKSRSSANTGSEWLDASHRSIDTVRKRYEVSAASRGYSLYACL